MRNTAVHGDNPVPVRQGQLVKIIRIHNTGIVDEDFHLSLLLYNLLKDTDHLIRIAQVYGVVHRIADFFAGLGSGFRIDVHDHRFPAHLHKLLGNRFANTLRCASNNASLAGERNVVQIHLEAPS